MSVCLSNKNKIRSRQAQIILDWLGENYMKEEKEVLKELTEKLEEVFRTGGGFK